VDVVRTPAGDQFDGPVDRGKTGGHFDGWKFCVAFERHRSMGGIRFLLSQFAFAETDSAGQGRDSNFGGQSPFGRRLREGAETERQLKLLTIQRLSQEKELFVLERQKMQLLSEEKELKADDSAFWNGSYLLEGVVDQNGYSQDTITIMRG